LTGSCICYYGIFRELRSHYRITAIDLPGMGISSRNEVEFKNFSDAERYFTEKVKYVLDTLNLISFTLIGHSVGGYISGLFSMKYPHMVENLVLLSPVGLSSSYIKLKIENPIEDFMKRFFYQVRSPPSFGYKILNIFSSYVLNKMLDTNFKTSWMSKDKEHFESFKEFMNSLMRNYCCSEKAMFHMFDQDLRAYKTLSQNYKKLSQLNILCIYGERDWNPKQHAEDLQMLIPSMKIEIIPDSSHVLYCDNNYVDMCAKIVRFCEGSTIKKEEQEKEKIQTVVDGKLEQETDKVSTILDEKLEETDKILNTLEEKHEYETDKISTVVEEKQI